MVQSTSSPSTTVASLAPGSTIVTPASALANFKVG